MSKNEFSIEIEGRFIQNYAEDVITLWGGTFDSNMKKYPAFGILHIVYNHEFLKEKKD